MERIVVGFDGSPDAEAALVWAMNEERLGDASVTALLAWSVDDCPRAVTELAGPVAGPQGLAAAARTLLERAVERHHDARSRGRVAVQAVEGRSAPALRNLMPDADLIVLGRHGAGGRRHVFSGSVTADLLHHATVPVVVVSAQQDQQDDHRPIVVGVDGSAPSLAALRWAAVAARRRGVKLVVVHAWVPVAAASAGFYGGYYAGIDLEMSEKVAREVLDDAIARGLGSVDTAVERRVIDGGAGAALLAASAGAQLLVVGSRGHGGFASLLLGSTAHQCVQHAGCPVIVCRDSSASDA
jgi:nucleotide-binding universal stress UspA family protein